MTTDVWSYALALYARPGVEEACLDLQDAGADVCLLLTGAWLGDLGIAYSDARLTELEAVAGPWQREVIAPLRQLRRAWRLQAEHDEQLAGLREQLKRLELEAEKMALSRLEDIALEWQRGAANDLSQWLEGCAGEAGRQRRAALDELRSAASQGA
ncbi:hypothetical protein D3C76_1028680 [compost metagenome]